MNDFVRCNKLSGIYWLKEPVENINIKIKLKPPDDILSLPKFEDFTNESNSINIESTIEEYTFKWQEKSFSLSEIRNYSDVHNCISETELQYHEVLKATDDITPSKVFSYIHDDYFKPPPSDNMERVNSLFESLCLNAAVGRIENLSGKSASMRHLFKSDENVCYNENWVAMHIVLDNSDYDEDSQLLLKKESTLLSLNYNISNKYIIITPDVNDLELNPYTVDDEASLGFKYEVDIDFGETQAGEDLAVLLGKLQKKWDRKHKSVINFITPSIGKVNYTVCIDILTAKGFERDNLYIEYSIKLPDGLECKDSLSGKTHISGSTTVDEDEEKIWNYGHLIDLWVETKIGTEFPGPPPLTLYLEVISIDWWSRHRTEGYSNCKIPLIPRIHPEQLPCILPEEPGGEERRFFVGGCHLLRDLEVLTSDELQNTNAVYKSSGSVSIRYNVLSQSSTPGAVLTSNMPSNANALLMGAETAIRKYKKARARLAAATKDIRHNMATGDNGQIQDTSV